MLQCLWLWSCTGDDGAAYLYTFAVSHHTYALAISKFKPTESISIIAKTTTKKPGQTPWRAAGAPIPTCRAGHGGRREAGGRSVRRRAARSVAQRPRWPRREHGGQRREGSRSGGAKPWPPQRNGRDAAKIFLARWVHAKWADETKVLKTSLNNPTNF